MAGQISLADALAIGTCARNVILLGDPQQIGQAGHPVRGGRASRQGHRDELWL